MAKTKSTNRNFSHKWFRNIVLSHGDGTLINVYGSINKSETELQPIGKFLNFYLARIGAIFSIRWEVRDSKTNLSGVVYIENSNQI